MFNGTNLTLNSDVDQDTKNFGSHEIPLTHRCIISKSIKIKITNSRKLCRLNNEQKRDVKIEMSQAVMIGTFNYLSTGLFRNIGQAL